MQHRSSCSHNRSVLPFGHPILLWVMGCRQLPFNSFCSTQKSLNCWETYSPPLSLRKAFYFLSRFFLNQGFKLTKPQEGLILLLHKVDPTSTRKIINKNNIVPLFSGGGCREWSTHICSELAPGLLQLYCLDPERKILHTYPRYNLCMYPLAQVFPWEVR
jgi:hypothetical protein